MNISHICSSALRFTVLLAVAAAGWHGSARAQAPGDSRPAESLPIRIAYTSGIFRDISVNDARASIKVWSESAARERQIPAHPEIEVIPDAATLADRLRSGQADFGAATMREFLEIEGDLALEPVLTIRRGQTSTVRYLLLVRTDGDVQSVSDLEGAELRLYDNPRLSLAIPWFEVLLAERGVPSSEAFVGKLVSSTRLSNVVLPVFFGQADACLVTAEGFLTMAELNPQVQTQLRVLAESPELIPMVSFFRHDFRPPFREELIRAICELDATASGRQILNLMQSDGVTLLQPSDLETTRDLLRRWRNRGAGVTAQGPGP